MKEELISVIVSVFNMEKVLSETLLCVVNQTYRNLEIILVDDGSTDSSGKICEEFAERDSRCRVIHKTNGGQSSAKNAGLDVATGAFIFFPDADDLFNLDMIRILYNAICEDSSYDIAIAGMQRIEDRRIDLTPSDEEINKIPLSRDGLVSGLFRRFDNRYVYGWNKLYKQELLTGIRFGNYPRHQDFDFNFRVFLHTQKAVFVDTPLYYWVRWEGSKTHQSNTWDLYYDCRTALLYDNWINLPLDAQRYGHYLLDALYRTMVLWEEWSRKSGNFQVAKEKCGKYRKNTVWKYVFSRQIGFGVKAVCLTMLAFPGLAHFVMKVTKNAR